MSAGCSLDTRLEINGRLLNARQRGDGIIWFDFSDLCEQPTSVADYIEIARAFNTVLLSGVPLMERAQCRCHAAFHQPDRRIL